MAEFGVFGVAMAANKQNWSLQGQIAPSFKTNIYFRKIFL